MEKELNELENMSLVELAKLKSDKDVNALYLKLFGQNGNFTKLLKKLKEIPQSERPIIGILANKIKKNLEEKISKQKKLVANNQLSDWLDVTAPGTPPKLGHLHIVSQTISEVTRIFERIGFTRRRYPEIEWEWYSFDSLNMPVNHPARDDFETFFIDLPPNLKMGKVVLSPHTSSGQVREMERAGKPPIRMINIAKCYRPNWDISHTPMFHQFEGLVIDKGINITHLKGTFEYFAKEFFGKDRKIRLRPFHFQFTEPSFEVDITCGFCKGRGCRLCKEGWMELCGSGMVHPNVLKAGKIDPMKYTGYAFGWGVERTYMMKQGLKIDDLRLLYSNDIRFLEQF
ncbi:phenylalanine--tRNA ligase subunit alpha [Candidatus Gottesmanbacteria bacterium RIFCSPHIGHO2_02_FULL_40_13]|uniref:Phenylalanine--tRNA ligase alpha subunit n=1 Tax=Candidatus Gottesmanbacteria bacterium RIFCSPHIGHO2_02_FULL_40_13 TaxID=1798384 RepID=A0A1F6A8B7_9BACT|nr:MAG: phenylalanine--tRNA ligase subunit alpha [Candidatus Gottesmanbacteria bacterium RIFCSPHIGHO2_02_FULL_40_13]